MANKTVPNFETILMLRPVFYFRIIIKNIDTSMGAPYILETF